MPVTTDMGLTLPTPGDTANVWDTVLNAAFGLIDSHDHTTGQGVLIPSAALGINADVSWAGFAISHLKSIYLSEQANAPTTSDSIFVLSSDHNLYFRNSSGVNVQITAGNTINVSVVGGIGGDYSSVSALLSYDDASKRYLLQQPLAAGLRPWAGLATADIDLYQKAVSIVNKVTLKSPAALGASYSLTFPAALPGSTLPLGVTSAGLVTDDGVFTGPLTATDYKLSAAQTLVIPATMMLALGGAPAATGGGTSSGVVGWSGANHITVPIPLRAGDEIVSYRLFVNKTSNAATTLSARIYQTRASAVGNETSDGAGNSTAANAPGFVQLSENGLTITLALGSEYYLVFTPSGSTVDVVYSLEVDYVRP